MLLATATLDNMQVVMPVLICARIFVQHKSNCETGVNSNSVYYIVYKSLQPTEFSSHRIIFSKLIFIK